MVVVELIIAARSPKNGETKRRVLELMEAELVIGEKDEDINAGH